MQERATYLPPGTSRFSLSHGKLSVLLAMALVGFYNLAFYRKLFAVYPLSFEHILFIASLTLLVTAFLSILLVLVT